MNDLKKIKYIKINDIIGIFIFILMIIPALILKLINIVKRRNLWLVTELKDTCRDNGYHFFKYVRINHPDDYCFYAINKNSKDYKKIEKIGNVINFGGIKYWLYYMAADKNIITNKATDPSHLIFYIAHKYLNLYNNCVFLQHGIIKDDIPMFYYKNTKFKLFICGAQKEYEYLKEKYGYPKDYIKYTGLARFDNLYDTSINKKQLLIMPTWRNWLGRDTNLLGEKENFESTEYFKNWNNLLNSKEFIDYIESYNLIVKFYPHYQMQKYIAYFKTSSPNIFIVKDSNEDIQELLKSSALLITDFSSVFMDFAYMRKPVLYYQFDEEKYRKYQLQQGYFDYYKNGFGPIVKTQNELIKEIKKFNLNFKPNEMYLSRMNEFFKLKDKHNCERIYNEIKKIDKRKVKINNNIQS